MNVPTLTLAAKFGMALLIANEIRGLIVVALIVKAWIATGAQF